MGRETPRDRDYASRGRARRADEAAAEEADDEAAAEGAEPGEEADDEAAAEGPEPGGGLLSVRTMPFSLCLLQKRAFEFGGPKDGRVEHSAFSH